MATGDDGAVPPPAPPGLDPADRAWLRGAIALTEPPRHPWLDLLGSLG